MLHMTIYLRHHSEPSVIVAPIIFSMWNQSQCSRVLSSNSSVNLTKTPNSLHCYPSCSHDCHPIQSQYWSYFQLFRLRTLLRLRRPHRSRSQASNPESLHSSVSGIGQAASHRVEVDHRCLPIRLLLHRPTLVGYPHFPGRPGGLRTVIKPSTRSKVQCR